MKLDFGNVARIEAASGDQSDSKVWHGLRNSSRFSVKAEIERDNKFQKIGHKYNGVWSTIEDIATSYSLRTT